jgi:chaperonin cofactor prefoldin
MSKEKEDTALIELDNRLEALEARIKKLENWELVHTSIGEEEETANQK